MADHLADRIYTALDPSQKEIRLCNMSRDGDVVPLHCELAVAKLTADLSYRCLSYVWGSAKDPKTIDVGGWPYPVTRNLHSALEQLRSRGIREDIWIDALCINQQDDTEKSSQVAMMGEIYAKADEMLIWLGHDFQHLPGGTNVSPGIVVEGILQSLAQDRHFHELPVPGIRQSQRCPVIHREYMDGAADWPAVLDPSSPSLSQNGSKEHGRYRKLCLLRRLL